MMIPRARMITRLVMLSASLLIASVASAKPFYFVQMTDTHLSKDDNLERTRRAIKQINALATPTPVQCVVVTGDITHDSIDNPKTRDEALRAFAELKAPVHYVPGNHDILTRKLDSTLANYEKTFGPLVTRAEYEGVVFIFIYTEPLRQPIKVKDYEPLKALRRELIAAKGKPVIVCHHAPSVCNFSNNKFHSSGWADDIRDQWVALLNEYNVKGVLAGHLHRDELYWLGNVPLFVCPPVSGSLGRQTTFRVYEYNDGKIGYRTQYVNLNP